MIATVLLAQILAPTLQPGPARLPTQAPAGLRPAPRLPPATPPRPAASPAGPTPPLARAPLPRVEGLDRLAPAELERLLAPCLREPDPAIRLRACAARLTARLVADGYINSRAYPRLQPLPQGTLVVVEGRIVEVRVRSSDARLQRRLQRIVLPLQGQVLHLPGLERSLDQLERLPGVGGISTSLNRLAGDSSKASLVIEADPAPRRLAGEVSLRNDGSTDSGQFRALGVLARQGLALPDDELLLVAELNSDSEPELGYSQASLSYALPLAAGWRFTTAVAASSRTPVEEPAAGADRAEQQTQLLGELDATLWEGLAGRLHAFAGLSANRQRTDRQGRLTTGYARAGLGFDAGLGSAVVAGSAYGMQAIAGLSGGAALADLARSGIRVGEARALAADLDIAWDLAPGWTLELRGAGQVAPNPLIDAMGFSLGSDSGLRGLPGQVTSGDSGLLGYGELAWQFWSAGPRALELVPFLGAGRVTTTVKGVTADASLGAGGVLLRWLQGNHWLLELGWTSQFGGRTTGASPSWLIDSGLYTRVSYSF